MAAGTVGVASGETEPTVVTAEVLSATNIDVATGCPSDTPTISAFGQLTPGTDNVLSADCLVEFGSSNDTSMLRAYQTDNTATAMAAGAAGELAASFGTSGYATHDLGGDEGATYTYGGGINQRDGGAIVEQPDGKFVVTGFHDGDMLIARFNTNGTLDTSGFNSPNGYRVLDLSGTVEDYGRGVTVDPSGDIVVTGQANCNVALVRLTPTGALDTSLAGSGTVVTNLPGACEYGTDVHVQSGGRIVVTGSGDNSDGLMLVAYTNLGAVDTSFSAPDGYSINEWTSGRTGRSVLDASDRIVIADSNNCICNTNVLRLTPTGSPDISFNGVGGNVVNRTLFDPTAQNAEGTGVFIDGSGRVVVTVTVDVAGNRDVGVARLLANGNIDNSFGGDGAVRLGHTGTDLFVRGGAVDDDGRYVVAYQRRGAGSFATARMARFLPSGNLDLDFAGVGWAEFDPPGSTSAGTTTTAPLVLANGRIVSALTQQNAGGEDLLLMALGGAEVPDYADDAGDTSGDDWGTPGAAFFGACLREALGAGATPAWTEDPDNDCTADDADPWYDIAQTSGDPSAKIAGVTTPGTIDATAALQFGFRTAADQAVGDYEAAITFEVTAPNV